MKNTLLLSLSVLFLLTACTGLTPVHIPGYWHQENVSQKDTQIHRAKCIYDVEMNKVSPEKEQRLINTCMVGKGFSWVPPRTVYR